MTRTPQEKFLEGLNKLLKQHKLSLDGSLRVYSKNDYADFLGTDVSSVEFIDSPTGKINLPHIVFTAKVKSKSLAPVKSDYKLTVFNRDVLFQNPVKSPVDGKHYTNRKTYDDHLKAHNCFEIGTEKVSTKKREIQGDFNVRKELTEAVNRYIQ